MVQVSVIIPCYNGGHYLPDAIDSALAQTFEDFELLIVDDGSTDETAAVAQSYVQRHPDRVRYLHQENQGLACARNRAIAEARGSLLALLDCDDLWLPDRLAAGAALMQERPEVGLVHANIIRINDQKERLYIPQREERYLSGRIYEHLYTRRAHIACPTVLFRRECIERVGPFDPALTRLGCEDRELWLRIAKVYEIAYIPRELAQYRVLPNSMSRNLDKMMRARMYVIEKHDDGTRRSGLLRRQAMASLYRELGDLSLAQGDSAEARRYFIKMMAAWPFDPDGLRPLIRSLLKGR